MEQDVDYKGNDIGAHISVNDAAACCDACQSAHYKDPSACQFWSYNPGLGHCYFKSSDAGRTTRSGQVSGTVKTSLTTQGALADDALVVDPDGGSDSNAGTEKKPLRTIHAALAKVKRGGIIALRSGTHFLDSTLTLGPGHSALTIRNFPGERPVVSGGKRVEVEWAPHQVAPAGIQIFEGTNVVHGGKPDDKTIRDYGQQTSLEACEALCAADAQCTGFTWHDETVREKYRLDCWGRLDGKWPSRADHFGDAKCELHTPRGPNCGYIKRRGLGGGDSFSVSTKPPLVPPAATTINLVLLAKHATMSELFLIPATELSSRPLGDTPSGFVLT